jgi:hypothetical protein
MASKNIGIREDVYERPKAHKRGDESFSDTFVKNRTSFPKHSGHRIRDLDLAELSTDRLVGSDGSDPVLDFTENKLRGDIAELNRLTDASCRILVLASNNGYLYHDPTRRGTEEYRYGELHHLFGRAACRWIADECRPGVGVLYVHPRGQSWLSQPTSTRGGWTERYGATVRPPASAVTEPITTITSKPSSTRR